MLASLTYLAMSATFPGDLSDVWGWRCRFLIGIVSSILGLFVFSRLEESPLSRKLAAEKAAKAAMQNSGAPVEVVCAPSRTLLSRDYRSILFVNLLLTIGGGSSYYLTFGYLPTFLEVVSHAPNGAAAAILMIPSVAVVIASIAAEHLSTFIGRKGAFVWIGPIRLFARLHWFCCCPQRKAPR